MTAPAAQAAPSLTINQIGGQSRYATAAQASASAFPAGVTRTAVLASGSSTVDALASSFVAGANSAPILLVERDSIPAETRAELTRLGVQRVILAGGTSVISAGVASQLAATFTVDRADGVDRYDTAAKLAALVSATPTTVFVASGPADAASISPVAAAKGWPVLLTAPNSVPAATRQALARYTGARVVVVGGTSAVSAQTATELGSTTRLTGDDRFQTAVNVAQFAIQSGFAANGFGLALGVNGAGGNDLSDALTAGPVLARTQSPLLLSASPSALGSATQGFLTANAGRFTTNAVVFGGPSAVSTGVVSAVATATGTTAPAPAPAPAPTPTPAPADTVAPVLRASTPASNGTNIAAGLSPTATFDEYLSVSGSSATIVRVDAPGTPIPASVSVVGSVITLDPTSDLAPGVQYRVTFSAQDIARNAATPSQFTFTTAAQAPTGVTGLTATPTAATANGASDGQLAVSWTAAAANGAAVDDYTVTLTNGPGGFSLPAPQTVTGTTATFTNLPVGAYTASVVANSTAGNSAAVTASGSIISPAGAPTSLTLGTTTETTQALSWTAPASTGGSAITGYTVNVYAGSSASGTPAQTVPVTGATTATVTGLTSGDTYTYTVVATNGAGPSAASNAVTRVTVSTFSATVTVASDPNGVAGTAEVGETVTIVFSEAIDPATLGSAASGILGGGNTTLTNAVGSTAFGVGEVGTLTGGGVNVTGSLNPGNTIYTLTVTAASAPASLSGDFTLRPELRAADGSIPGPASANTVSGSF
ncbi:cell wall-binding repeat-containing protein [Kineococcus sp. SYSU DK006]|uniref:cell wall-binding repeat-containing protein n=1 Tax=Kineococcus sp. SYSU DK006 TaxID=3383127 RepID=UPI003D7C6579